MITPLPIFEGCSLINKKTNNLISEASSEIERAPQGRVVSHGQFKGHKDCRGKRCYNKACRDHVYGNCRYCSTLPYVLSKLRNHKITSTGTHAFDLWRSRKGTLDVKLRLLIDELQEFAETDFMSLGKLSVKASPSPMIVLKNDENAVPTKRGQHMMAAKDCFVKMRAKFWAGQANLGYLKK